MPWRPHGRATVDPSNPNAFGVCDRCGLWYNLKDLVSQPVWAGPRLMNKRILVCTATCLDVPNEGLRTIILPPDPVPVRNPRPELFFIDDTTQLQTEAYEPFATEDDENMYTENSSPPASN